MTKKCISLFSAYVEEGVQGPAVVELEEEVEQEAGPLGQDTVELQAELSFQVVVEETDGRSEQVGVGQQSGPSGQVRGEQQEDMPEELEDFLDLENILWNALQGFVEALDEEDLHVLEEAVNAMVEAEEAMVDLEPMEMDNE